MLLQQENEYMEGYYCHTDAEFFVSHWHPVMVAGNFVLRVIIPFLLIAHNSVRIGRTLFNSLKESAHLKEGNTAA